MPAIEFISVEDCDRRLIKAFLNEHSQKFPLKGITLGVEQKMGRKGPYARVYIHAFDIEIHENPSKTIRRFYGVSDYSTRMQAIEAFVYNLKQYLGALKLVMETETVQTTVE